MLLIKPDLDPLQYIQGVIDFVLWKQTVPDFENYAKKKKKTLIGSLGVCWVAVVQRANGWIMKALHRNQVCTTSVLSRIELYK